MKQRVNLIKMLSSKLVSFGDWSILLGFDCCIVAAGFTTHIPMPVLEPRWPNATNIDPSLNISSNIETLPKYFHQYYPLPKYFHLY